MKKAEKETKSSQKSYLVDVSLISKTAGRETVSYFSSTKLEKGAIVRVPVRGSTSPALVLRSRDVRSAKTEIRRAGFLLKKIKASDISGAVFPEETLIALEETAKYYATSIGSLLSVLIPKLFLEEPDAFLNPGNARRKKHTHAKEIELLQMEGEERYGQYRAIVRQAFARGSSVLFVVPTHLDCAKAQRELSIGIAEYVHVFTLTGKKSENKKKWQEALNEKHPILLITTPAGIFFPREDIDTLIIERENSRSYRTLTRPYIHLRNFLEIWSRKLGRHFVMGDSVLSIETLWREKQGHFGESSLIRWRLTGAKTILTGSLKGHNENGRFEIITPELRAMLEKAASENEKIFLFGARKGLNPTTVCGDCGTVLPCLNCGAPVVLHHLNENSIYICHACGARRDSTTTCGYCGSWKLVPLGIGTEQIARAVKDLFPQQNVYLLDKEHSPSDKTSQRIIQNFEKTGGILVGTELAFFHLESVAYSGLVSVDTLFSIPDFGINERIFYIVSRLREMAKNECVIQTRNIGKQILAWAAQGNIIDFYQSEIAEREALLYPPFSIFIKVTVPKKDMSKELLLLKGQFLKWQPDILRDSLVIRAARDNWPEEELVTRLSLLGPQFSIKVDPESIL